MVQAVPEMKGIFDQAVAEGWTSDRFVLAVQNTQWWKTNSEAVRGVVNLQATDPATYGQQLSARTDAVNKKATQLGYTTGDTALAQLIAYEGWLYNWSDDQIQEQIARRMQLSTVSAGGSDAYGGQAGQLIAQMQKIGQDYGVRMTGPGLEISTWANDIVAGSKTLEQYQQLMQANAISAYPGIRSMIESGYTVADIASPYISAYAGLLEINPGSVDFQNTTLIKQALQGTGSNVDANGIPSQTPLWQFEKQVKSEPQYGFTKGARAEVDSYVNRVGKDFGFL